MKNITDLEIRFIPHADLTPALQLEFDELDRLAFGEITFEEDPDFPAIKWATPNWMAMGFLQGQLVTQVCLPEREITVGGEKIRVAGLGAMATHPKFQHQGLGSLLLDAAKTFMRDSLQVPFGLLICAARTCPFYELSQWQVIADCLSFWQDGYRRELKTCVMILPLTDRPWPAGEIDLRGLPW